MARRTPLHEAHVALGARWVEFAGWEMPLAYAGAGDEHRCTRERCGLFDVSHMGTIELTGPNARTVCQEITVNDVDRLEVGQGQYTLLCNERGGIIDDLILFRVAHERYRLVVNAGNRETDLRWIETRSGGRAVVHDRSAEMVLVALQGPEATDALDGLTDVAVSAVPSFGIVPARVAGENALVSRTGYTGEEGFEIAVPVTPAERVWTALLAVVRAHGGCVAGLGARDTLRLEAGLLLHGVDMDADTTPLEAGLDWVVRWGKGGFVGREALEQQVQAGVSRRLVGVELDEPGIPRHGCRVWRGDERVGVVTSGARSPTLGRFIGLAYVAPGAAAPGTPIAVEIRGRLVAGRVVARPFYRRGHGEDRA
jgi:aminomethyltransferase